MSQLTFVVEVVVVAVDVGSGDADADAEALADGLAAAPKADWSICVL
jgi:hypothetical protein